MIDSLIHYSIKNKLIIGLAVVALVIWGGYSLVRLPIDAVPDITTNQVQILTLTPTLAAQEVEQFVTTPIELSLANIPDITEVRSVSKLGLSVVTVVFKDEVDIVRGKQWVTEQLKTVEADIPVEFGKPMIAPLTTGLGEIYQYTLAARKGYEHKYDLTELRTIQDWIVKRQLVGIEGVIEISSFGGYVKQYEVSVDPQRLHAGNVTLTELFEALQSNNANTGGSYIERVGQAQFIRGEGVVKSLSDIEQIVIKNGNGVPVLVKDVANVGFGHANRFGALVRNGEGEAVGGIVLMLKGANSANTVNAVKERIARIQKTLPEGIEIVPFIERTKLINKTITTVTENLLLGGLIVIVVLVMLMGSLRAGLVAASVIPLAMLFTIGMMNTFGISANLMSLGAIDFGVIVDGAVIIVEAIVHRFQLWYEDHKQKNVDDLAERDAIVYETAKRIRTSAAFGEIIILMVYLPILSLVGIEGKMFKPMALTVGFAILGAFILSLTYVPMMASLVMGKNLDKHWNFSERVLQWLYRRYEPLIQWSLNWKKATVGITLALFTVSLFIFNQLGGEFVPTLDEGDLAIDFRTASGTSLTETINSANKAHQILKKHFPEIQQIVGRVGASEIPTDPMPIEMVDQMINMKDISEWKSAKNREEMSEKMAAVLAEELPGTSVEMTQPIQMRFNEMITGVRSDVVVKIFGNDLDVLFERANAAAKVIEKIAGVASVRVEQIVGLPQISIAYNRAKIAQYGLHIADINRLIRGGFAGETAGTVYEQERRYELVVRLDTVHRQNIENVRQLLIPLPAGGTVPLAELADIGFRKAPAQISHEETRRRITIGIGVLNRDVESVVNDVQAKIEKQVSLPSGYFFTYGGAFENLQRAKERLSFAVPVALFLIFTLLYFTFSSLKESLLIFTAVPMSAIGGIIALWLRDMPFSISAGVGFIALFGVAVLNGIVLISYLNDLEKEGISDLRERIMRTVEVRFRPVIITATVASLGFLPMAISNSGGAEVQRPLATVVIGGILSATLLTLVVLPVLYALVAKKNKVSLPKGGAAVVLLLLVAGAAKGQNQSMLTLTQAIEQATKENLTLKTSQYSLQSQQALVGSAWQLPKLSADLLAGQIQNRPFDYTLSAVQSFEPFGVYRSRERILTQQVNVTQKQQDIQRNELIFNVKQQYYQLLFLYRLRQLLQVQDTLYQKAFEAANVRYKTGEATLLERVAAETNRREIQNRRVVADRDLQVSYFSLQTLLYTTEQIQIDTLLNLQRPYTAPEGTNRYVALAEEEAKLSRTLTELERAQLKPDWRVGVANQSIEKRLGFTYVSGGLGIPLQTKPQKARIEAARINEQASETQLKSVQFQTDANVKILRESLNKLQNTLQYYEQSALPQADLLLKTTYKQFRLGDIEYVEFFQNTRQAWQIRENYLSEQLRFSQTVIELEKWLGIE
ncbi:MAG: CusA/CzcA family heavy metal efflux RND transporter [Spirosomataceae bacterium]